MPIATPEQPLDPFQLDRQANTCGVVVVGDAWGVLFRHRRRIVMWNQSRTCSESGFKLGQRPDMPA